MQQMMNRDYTLEMYKTAYKYFEFHAKQRTASFKFYITISLGIITFIGTAANFLQNIGASFYWLLFLVEIIISFLFWHMDKRILTLIHIAEKTIIEFEKKYIDQCDDKTSMLNLFTKEKRKTDTLKRSCCYYLTYTRINMIIYLLFSLLVLIITLYKVTKL